ncbi:hypothetical protein Poly24_22840 [Rosistilla carotiformis]|uniref:YetF C-terminal domain-containing protein n=1 Tax=Rosistilla carotiformis TaxID=2528017 RepID=A0A518JSQ4_9BACT|nr:YetF domain-containing protein [Rosistilla carotiformis]QDV68574.1 hypothetical protein Poly24_22840 [Rosistilla carotiformis]
MFEKWIHASPNQLGMILLSTVCVYAAILVYTRVSGLRSFSKMSAADFAMTIAIGSLFGATISTPSPTLLMGGFALLCVFVGQTVVAWLRRKSPAISKLVDNQPLLLMAGSEILRGNLRRANLTEADLRGKLRQSNVYRYDDVLAVVFETTGDVSVLQRDDRNAPPDQEIFEGVIDSDRLNLQRCQSQTSGRFTEPCPR